MKYMENGSFQNNPLTRLTLWGTFLFLSGLWASSFGMYFSRMGLSAASVAAYYRGSDETFQPARTFGSMVESSHVHFAMMALVLLVLTHLFVFVPARRRTKEIAIGATFGASFLNEASGWLVRYVHPGFALLKPAAFLASQLLIGVLLGLLAAFLVRAGRRLEGRASSADERRPLAGGEAPGPETLRGRVLRRASGGAATGRPRGPS